MTVPSAAFSLVCAWLIGALFHVVVDGGGARLLLYLALSTLGFLAGHIVAAAQGWSFVPVGPLQLGFAAARQPGVPAPGPLAEPGPS